MKKMEVVSGDIDPGKWEISPDGIRKGKYVVKSIPINDIVGLEKKEEIGRSIYANIELGTGSVFVAKMGIGAYKQLYSLFLSGGNNPKSSSLPIEKVSVLEVSILVIISLVLIIAFIR